MEQHEQEQEQEQNINESGQVSYVNDEEIQEVLDLEDHEFLGQFFFLKF